MEDKSERGRWRQGGNKKLEQEGYKEEYTNTQPVLLISAEGLLINLHVTEDCNVKNNCSSKT